MIAMLHMVLELSFQFTDEWASISTDMQSYEP